MVLTFVGLLNRFQWMQELFPSSGEELLLFKTSISFIDHIQEFLSAILTSSALIIPPMKELKEKLYSVVNFIQVESYRFFNQIKVHRAFYYVH